ncbi:hypothetical protein [Alienimonas californiensis]|nr:hypothetical protein [Alienimonas californiensis]
MADQTSFPVIICPVQCFDRTRENPFPLYVKWYWIDPDRLSVSKRQELREVLVAGNRSPHSPKGFDEVVVTVSSASLPSGRTLLRFREHFQEVPQNDRESFMSANSAASRGANIGGIDPDYTEDEQGRPISMYEMIQHVSGQEFPIIMGDPGSVLRLGPTPAVNTKKWNVKRANCIAQFLEVVERIQESDWRRSPHTATWTASRHGGDTTVQETAFPTDHQSQAVLAYFRQLHAKDKLFAKACETYLEHVGDQRKRVWVHHEKEQFVALVDSPPAPYDAGGATRRQVLQMYMYGAGLLHSSADYGDDKRLSQLIEERGHAYALTVLNSCLMDFLRCAAKVYPVIRQDYEHWVSTQGLTPPTRQSIKDLFRNISTPPCNGGEPST